MIESGQVKDQIREYVLEEFAKTKGIDQITDQENLTKNGIIDSMGIFRLVAFLEETFNVTWGTRRLRTITLRVSMRLNGWSWPSRKSRKQPTEYGGHLVGGPLFVNYCLPPVRQNKAVAVSSGFLMRIGRKVFSNGVKLLDLLLMMVAFAAATLPLYHRVGRDQPGGVTSSCG